MIRNKVVWDKHYYSNRFTVRNIFLLSYSRLPLNSIGIYYSQPLLAKDKAYISKTTQA